MKKSLLFLGLAVLGFGFGFAIKTVQSQDTQYLPMQAAPVQNSQSFAPSGGGSCGS